MGFRLEEFVRSLSVGKYSFCALEQHVCIALSCAAYVNHFTSLLSTVVRRFMSMLISSVCLDTIVSNRMKDSSVYFCVCFAVTVFQYCFWPLERTAYCVLLCS
jgi:hypothetical protein